MFLIVSFRCFSVGSSSCLIFSTHAVALEVDAVGVVDDPVEGLAGDPGLVGCPYVMEVAPQVRPAGGADFRNTGQRLR